MSSFTYLISGASRSLGLGYSRALLASSQQVKVVAGARNPSSAEQLQALQKEVGKDRLYILKLDVEDASGVQVRFLPPNVFPLFPPNRLQLDRLPSRSSSRVASSSLAGSTRLSTMPASPSRPTLLRQRERRPVSSAASSVYAETFSSDSKPDLVMQNLQTNLFGVMNLTSACLPLLKKGKGKQIFGVSSICGSLGGYFSDNSLATAVSSPSFFPCPLACCLIFALTSAASWYSTALARLPSTCTSASSRASSTRSVFRFRRLFSSSCSLRSLHLQDGFTVVPYHPGYVKTVSHSFNISMH